MKLVAPAGCTQATHAGQRFIVARDGTLEVGEAAARALAAHGFVRKAPAPAPGAGAIRHPAGPPRRFPS